MIHALALAGALAGPAGAQEAVTLAEAVRTCVEAAERAPEAERACIGVAALACIDAGGAAAAAPGMAGCYREETAAWDLVMAATYDDLLGLSAALAAAGAAPADQAALLGAAQAAWATFRDADCAQAAAHWGEDPMREVTAAECRLDRTATRALELIERRRGFENP